MRIVYVGRHNQNNADDEGSITHAFRELGHSVLCLQESLMNPQKVMTYTKADLLIFNKWEDIESIKAVSQVIPTVFWYFDLVAYSDPMLADRCKRRIQWMSEVTPLVLMGFCTDGDWVQSSYNTDPRNASYGKLSCLSQGFDSRLERGVYDHGQRLRILFTGIRKGGSRRESFVDEMNKRYGIMFCNVNSGMYRERLANMVASTDIIVAPDSPSSDRYWSNRVYNTLGLGGFLLHPYCRELTKQYEHGRDLVYYTDRMTLHDCIAHYMNNPKDREQAVEHGRLTTLAKHTYRHRVEQMLAKLAMMGIK